MEVKSPVRVDCLVGVEKGLMKVKAVRKMRDSL